MKTVTITIIGINSDGTLKLSDGGLSDASRGDAVQWIIDPGSGVASITAIQDDLTKGIDIFSPDPVQDPNTLVWSGTVGSTLSVPCEETYIIQFTPTGSNEVHRFDPKIQVDS